MSQVFFRQPYFGAWEGRMAKTTLIAQLMASFAHAAFIAGYSTAEMAELVAFGGSADVDHQSDRAKIVFSAATQRRSARVA